MAIVPTRLIAGSQLTASAATYYTATNVKARIDALALTNTSGSSATATVHLVPSGGAADDTNCIVSAKSLAPGETFVPPGAIGQWIESGGTLQALASAGTAITLVASGVEYAA
jgi:hypothetical protein